MLWVARSNCSWMSTVPLWVGWAGSGVMASATALGTMSPGRRMGRVAVDWAALVALAELAEAALLGAAARPRPGQAANSGQISCQSVCASGAFGWAMAADLPSQCGHDKWRKSSRFLTSACAASVNSPQKQRLAVAEQ